jgi:hypothetical protein
VVVREVVVVMVALLFWEFFQASHGEEAEEKGAS